MFLSSVSLENFRNYEAQSFAFDPSFNLICGENAQGKTNLLEAVAALSTMRLFRTNQKKEGIRFGEEYARICGDFLSEQQKIALELRIFQEKSMEIRKNGVVIRRQNDARGLFRTVLFCPEDLSLIREGAAGRRRFLDTALCQLRPYYARYLTEYNRVLEQKTRILKDSEEKPSLLDILDDYSARMAYLGARLIRYRASYVEKLSREAKLIYQEIAPQEELAAVYETVKTVIDPLGDVKEIEARLLEHLAQHRAAEIAAKTCLSGCHKDDLMVFLDGRPAAAFGSQGQVRTAALSLKLAERQMFFHDGGEYPVLLLDDVLSELDARRRDFVLNHIAAGQVMITCCEPEAAGLTDNGRVFRIAQGKTLV